MLESLDHTQETAGATWAMTVLSAGATQTRKDSSVVSRFFSRAFFKPNFKRKLSYPWSLEGWGGLTLNTLSYSM